MAWVNGVVRNRSRRNAGEANTDSCRSRRTQRAVAAVAVACLLAAPAHATSQAKEYALKAAFLYQFTKYVTWPEAGTGPITICVLGDDPFGPVLDETLADKSTQGRSIVVRRIRSAAAGNGCRILFVSRSAQADLGATLTTLGDQPTLTVADTAGFPSRGGMINLKLVNERIKLEVNPGNAERVGLKIRSELLRLADVVR